MSIERTVVLLAAGFGLAGAGWSGAAGAGGDSIARIKAVGHEGEGNVEAAAAWADLTGSKEGAGIVLEIVDGMDDANPLAMNWLRSAADTIAGRELGAGRELPVAELKEIVLDANREPRAREFAFELIERADRAAAAALVPGFAHDPSSFLRRLAVAELIAGAGAKKEAGDMAGAKAGYREALDAAREVDQINVIAKQLAELDETVDLPRHFGFLMRWKVIGPFDNTDRKGFAAVYPPEEEIDLEAAYGGKEGEVRWSDFVSADDYGMIDINKLYGPLKQVTAYAYTEYESDAAREVELRLGCKNAWKVWVNGELLFARDEYHRGMRIDQYRLPVELAKGKNTILVKACQNEQEQDWTVEWQFQLRVCDETGTAVPAANRLPTPKKSEATGAPRQRRVNR